MADLEARREARRRKILENSERRLKKIGGVEQKTTKSELDGICYNVAFERETDANFMSNNIAENSIPQLDTILNPPNQITSNSSTELKTIFENSRSIESDSVSISNCYARIMEQKYYRNYFIFVMPILLSIVLVVFQFLEIDVRPLYINKIFIPLLAYEITEYYFGTSVPTSFLSSLLLLTSIRSSFIRTYLQYVQCLLKILQDVMIYFFVFTISHLVLQAVLVRS